TFVGGVNHKLAKCNQIIGSLYCSITPRGTKWLDKSNSNRLKHYLANLRKTILTHDSQDKATIKALLKSHEPARLYREEWPQRTYKYLDLRGAAFSAFNTFLDWDLPVSLNSFIRIQCNNNNPLLRLFHAGVPLIVIHDCYDIFLDTPNEIIDYWKDRLMSFMLNVMLPLGCFSFGTDQASGQTVLSLSDTGRFLLGKLDSIQTNENTSPNIIVQPNFEIVFLNNFASAEAKLVRLAQRVGINVGTLFKLTRESIFNAVENGMNATAIIQTLTDISCKPLPGNVEEQLKSWVKQCRHISVSHPVMLQCPDKETVLRIKAIGGIKVTVVSDTILTVSNRKDIKPLMKKLNKKGIFRE
ncbi:MAG: helicase-associated domain-containing protein, partial [Candidatus Sabulitectum sp.]|nr:helicase-associated domain-containing protein [Candidatus Sabulitectum sp.]